MENIITCFVVTLVLMSCKSSSKVEIKFGLGLKKLCACMLVFSCSYISLKKLCNKLISNILYSVQAGVKIEEVAKSLHVWCQPRLSPLRWKILYVAAAGLPAKKKYINNVRDSFSKSHNFHAFEGVDKRLQHINSYTNSKATTNNKQNAIVKRILFFSFRFSKRGVAAE